LYVSPEFDTKRTLIITSWFRKPKNRKVAKSGGTSALYLLLVVGFGTVKLKSHEELPAEFGKYVLTRLIATGGMAEIFLAHEKKRPDEQFVIKRILPHLIESSEFVSMFLDEARIAAQLHHENIVEIFDVGRVEGSYFIAMEYVHGEDIRRIYNQAFKLQRSLPLSHSIRVIAEASVGLGFAHRLPGLTGKPLGVVHRDVSPQNILVTYDGSVKIVDFGIAKAASKVSETRAGVLKGKYSYMSPEQATGDPLDHRTDIFALGIILYETTTGTRLFKRQNELATLQAIMRCEFKPPSDVLRGYPVELEQILLKALAMDVSDRYQNAEDFSRDLFQFLRNSGLHVERGDISEFMHDLFEPESQAETPGHKRFDTALERKATNTELQPSPASVVAHPVEERHAIERKVTLTKAEGGLSNPDDTDEATEAHDAQAIAALIEAPGFVDAEGFSAAGNTVAEKDIQEGKKTPTIGNQKQRPGLNDSPVVAAAYGAHSPAKDEIATVAVARAYRPPQANTPHSSPNREKKPAPASRAISAPKAQPALRTYSTKLLIGVFGLTFGLIGIIWILLTTPLDKGELKPATEVQEGAQNTKPSLKPISRVRGGAGAKPASQIGKDKGKLFISTLPGAAIMHKDVVLGTANDSGKAGPFRLGAGRARLRASLSERGFERFLTVYIKAGAEHSIDMKARKGKLILKTNPGAQVELNGSPKDARAPSFNLDEGTHHLLIQHKKMSKRYESMIRLSAGEQKIIDIDLTRVGEDL
jgi:serine/threonine protein kinase